jgi:hypothetical protein
MDCGMSIMKKLKMAIEEGRDLLDYRVARKD